VAGDGSGLRQALASLRAGRAEEAESLLRELLRLQPQDAGARQLLGIVLLELGRPAPALLELDAVAPLLSTSPALHYNRGIALAALGRLEEAAAAYERACVLKPDLAQAQANAGKVLRALGSRLLESMQDEAAIAAFERALAHDPASWLAHNQRGVALHRLGRAEEALAAFDSALALRPEAAEAWNNRGNAPARPAPAAARAGGVRSARCSCSAISPRRTTTWAWCCRTCVASTRRWLPTSARSPCARAIPKPSGGARRCGCCAATSPRAGRTSNTRGNWRWRERPPASRGGAAKRWPANPSCCRSRTASAMCCSSSGFVPRLLERGARVAFAGPARLRRLLSGFDARIEFVDEGADAGFDYRCWLWSLPHWLGIGGEVAAGRMPYLQAEPERVAQWAGSFDPGDINIGICWQGNPGRRIDRGRSIPLAGLPAASGRAGRAPVEPAEEFRARTTAGPARRHAGA
jgi:Flp pilus assembly protein TadD